jgi:hypothetical protein
MPAMPKHIEFCLPTSGKAVPSGPDWIARGHKTGFMRPARPCAMRYIGLVLKGMGSRK